MNGSRTVDQIASELDQEEKLMLIHEKNGNYADAEKNRLKIQQLKKNLEARTLYEMEQRHRRETAELEKTNAGELAAYRDHIAQRMKEIADERQIQENDLLTSHNKELQDTRKVLEAEFSTKVKESSDLLNLRTMEQHMVKQKAFAEAHKVQQEILQREKQEKKGWMEKRQEKIEIALVTLRGQMSVELANLRKRTKTLLDEQMTESKIEQDRLLKKHENFHRDLKSQQEKQILSYKGEFRSKGGKDSPIRSKGSFTN